MHSAQYKGSGTCFPIKGDRGAQFPSTFLGIVVDLKSEKETDLHYQLPIIELSGRLHICNIFYLKTSTN